MTDSSLSNPIGKRKRPIIIRSTNNNNNHDVIRRSNNEFRRSIVLFVIGFFPLCCNAFLPIRYISETNILILGNNEYLTVQVTSMYQKQQQQRQQQTQNSCRRKRKTFHVLLKSYPVGGSVETIISEEEDDEEKSTVIINSNLVLVENTGYIPCRRRRRNKKSTNNNNKKRKNHEQQQQQQNILSQQNGAVVVDLPPWLSRHYISTTRTTLKSFSQRNNNSKNSKNKNNSSIEWNIVEDKMKCFEYSLLEEHGWSINDVKDIMKIIYSTVTSATTTSSSRLLLNQEEKTKEGITSIDYDRRNNNNTNTTRQTGMIIGLLEFLQLIIETIANDAEYSSELKPTKELLIASILHYVECVVARHEGATEIIKNALFGISQQQQQYLCGSSTIATKSKSSSPSLCLSSKGKHLQKLPPCPSETSQSSSLLVGSDPFSSMGGSSTDEVMVSRSAIDDIKRAQPVIPLSPYVSGDRGNYGYSELLDCISVSSHDKKKEKIDSAVSADYDNDYHFSSEQQNEILSIVQGAAKIKRAEILVQAFNEQQLLTAPAALHIEEADRIRGLLLTVGTDWRSLALRCIACLYRLDGILASISTVGVYEYQSRTSEIVRTTREGLRIYATLAEQLGLHRLKSRIEDRAFKILYRRQYAAVMSLYNGVDYEDYEDCHRPKNEILQKVSFFLQSQVNQILAQDDTLTSQLEKLDVTGRVKEPYSFWRKILKSKKKSIHIPKSRAITVDRDESAGTGSDLVMQLPSKNMNPTLAVTDVHDTVALRVILKARKLTVNEPDEVTRSREESLCYHVQQLLLKHWPVTDPKRKKDYIKNPKPNGYRSLHFTAIHKNGKIGCEFPFELQIRSEEMHDIAEYGVASHWGYKLGYSTSSQTEMVQSSHVNVQNTVKLLSSAESWEATNRNVNSHDDSITSNWKETKSKTGYLDALEIVRSDMIRHQVYVFLAAKGDMEKDDCKRSGCLLSLPINSCIRDAVAAMNCSSSGDDAVAHVVRNGRIADLDDIVKNGDILMIH